MEGLSYVNEIEGCSDIYFVVLSKDKGDVKYKDKETEKDVISSKTSNVESKKKSSVSAVSNVIDNKEKITVYSLCVHIYSRKFINKEIFSGHMNMVKIGLKHKTHLPKLKKNRHTSYSMMSAINDGFNVVFYSQIQINILNLLHYLQ